MSEFDVVQIVSLLGFLILALSALASHKLNWKQGITMALAWLAIFSALALFFNMIGASL